MADDLNVYLMSCDPMYSAKRLSHWMKTTFADDLAKDLRKMEGYRKIGREGEEAAAAIVQPPAVPVFAPEAEPDKTEVWGDDDMPVMDIGDEDVIEVGNEGPENATMLFDTEAAHGDPLKTMLFDTSAHEVERSSGSRPSMRWDGPSPNEVGVMDG